MVLFYSIPIAKPCRYAKKAQQKQNTGHIQVKKHVLLAEEFAEALKKNPPVGFSQMEKITPATFEIQLSKKTGVIFFKDY